MPTLRILALLAVTALSASAAEVKYQLVPNFLGTPPGKATIGNSHGEIAVDSAGLIYVSVQEKDAGIQVYGKDGKYLKTLPLPMSLHGFVIRKSAEGEFLYGAVLGEQRFLKAKLDGTIVMEIKPDAFPADKGVAKDKKGKAVNALKLTSCDVAPNGDIYVADGYGSQFILRFDKDGKYLSKFGGKSTQPTNPGKFMQAHGVAIDTRGPEPLLVCTERVRNEFNWFTLEGKHVRGVYLPGAYVSRPVIAGKHLYSGVCFGAKPDDYRMWQGRGFVTILDENNRVVSNPGGQEPKYVDGRLQAMLQDQPVFNNCHDVCVDARGDLYVCQWASGSVYPYKLHRLA